METLNIDFMGPFPPDEYGNTMVLTIIDSFTRAIGLYAVTEATAKECLFGISESLGVQVRLYQIEVHSLQATSLKN